MRALRNIWADQHGNTAMIFGLAVVPIIALAGGAVDFSHRADVRMRVQSASDSAALAAARAMQSGAKTDAAGYAARKALAEASARDIFAAALAGSKSQANPVVSIDNGIVSVSADVAVDTAFLTILGIDSLAADGFAQVSLPKDTPVEIALVLDYSGSMRDNDKYIRMTSAAQSFIAKIATERSDTTKMGIVPFSEYVLAGVPGSDIRDVGAADANTLMTTCLLNRDYPYAASDETPNAIVPESRWRQVDAAAPECAPYLASAMQVRDLTDDFAGLRDALGGMSPLGKTNIALATEIGFHVLTSNAPFETASEPSEKEVKKVLIVLTDGVQTVEAMGPAGDISVAAANATTAELCANVKAKEIEVYTIAYDVDDPAVTGLLSGCASSPQAYHEVRDASDISAVFDEIYKQMAASVWLSR